MSRDDTLRGFVGSRGLGLAATLSPGALLSAVVRAAEAAVGAVKEVLLSRLLASVVGFGAIDVRDDAVVAGFAEPTAGFAVVEEGFAANGLFVATDDFKPFCGFEVDAALRRSSALAGKAAPPLTAAVLVGSAGLIEPGSSAPVVGLSGFAGFTSPTSIVSCSPRALSFSSIVVAIAAATGKKLDRTLLRGLLSSASRPASPRDLPRASREFSAALFSNSDRRLRTADEDRSGDIY